MTVTNPFTLATITTADASSATETETTAPATPYADLGADTSRPAAFALAFIEPTAA